MDKKQTPHRQKPNITKSKAGHKHPSGSASKKFIHYPGVKGRQKGTNLNKRAQAQKSRKDLRKQRNHNRIITGVLVSILLAICLYISLKVLFIVRSVESAGSERYTREEIIAFCAIPMEMPIFEVEAKEIAAALPENFTYIESAQVIRRLPDKILVKVVDSIPTYYNETKDGELSTYTIYSQGFKQLTVQAAAPVGMLGINRDLTNENHKSTLLQIIDMINKKGYTGVSCIQIGRRGDISLVYQDRVEVKLGTMLDMEYKLKMSFHILQKEISPSEKGVIDSTTAGSAVFKPAV